MDAFNTEDGMQIPLEGSAKIEIVDNAKDFDDVDGHWGKDSIDFVSSRNIFNGVSEKTFAPDQEMTRGMIFKVIANMEGADTTAKEGEAWYQGALDWAVENGVSDGTNPEAAISREQIVTMLWRYIGSPESESHHIEGFADKNVASPYATEALCWAVEHGIINGMGDGTIAPDEDALRAQVAKIVTEFIKYKK